MTNREKQVREFIHFLQKKKALSKFINNAKERWRFDWGVDNTKNLQNFLKKGYLGGFNLYHFFVFKETNEGNEYWNNLQEELERWKNQRTIK